MGWGDIRPVSARELHIAIYVQETAAARKRALRAYHLAHRSSLKAVPLMDDIYASFKAQYRAAIEWQRSYRRSYQAAVAAWR